MSDADYFLELQTQTGWGRILARFADWIAPQEEWLALDVGCGPGLLPALLAQKGCCAFGVDRDPQMFCPAPLHPQVSVANVDTLPFAPETFALVSASNLLFLFPDPQTALQEMVTRIKPGGEIALLNPSENLSVAAATQLADQRGLQGLARQTLLNYATRAERHHRWTEAALEKMFASAGVKLTATQLVMGPGFARMARGKISH